MISRNQRVGRIGITLREWKFTGKLMVPMSYFVRLFADDVLQAEAGDLVDLVEGFGDFLLGTVVES